MVRGLRGGGGSAKARRAVRYLVAIAANDIDQAGILIDEVVPKEWIEARLADETYHALSDGRFWGRLSRSGKLDVVVRGSVTAEVEMPCARCLGPTKNPIKGEISLLLKCRPGSTEFSRIGERWPAREKHPKGHRSAEYEFTSEEAEVDEYDGEVVILDDFVREVILLELPNFPLCSESCTGISAEFEDVVRGMGSGPGGSSKGQVDRHRAAPPRSTGQVGLESKSGRGPASLGSGVNPFEALIHLRPTLARGQDIDGAPELATPAPSLPVPLDRSRRKDFKAASKATKKNDTKITSTHAAPGRHAPAKKSVRADKRSKRR